MAPADFATLLKEQWRLKPDALSAEQTAQLLGYTTTTVAKWIKAGKFNAIPCQRGYMIPKEWLVRHLADTVNDNRATKSEKHMRLIRECQKN